MFLTLLEDMSDGRDVRVRMPIRRTIACYNGKNNERPVGRTKFAIVNTSIYTATKVAQRVSERGALTNLLSLGLIRCATGSKHSYLIAVAMLCFD